MEFYTYRISDVFERFSSGKNITEDKISNSDKYPVYGGNGLRGYTDTSNFKGECILIGRQGAKCGNVRYFNGEGYMTDHAIVGVCKPNHNTQFMNYALASLDLNRLSGQAAQPGLSVGMLKKQKILLPSLENQAKIAKIVFRYNNLIENNNRRIALLEKAAQELYKEWFVRFRFPGHVTAKFENGLPEGWKVEKIGKLCKIITGKKDANEATGQGVYPFFTCARETTTFTDEYILDTDAILISGNGSYTGLVKKHSGKFDLYQRTYALFDFENIEWLYAYWNLKINFEREFMGGSRGSAIPYITRPNIEKYKVVVPTKELMVKAQEIFEVIYNECLSLEQQNKNLTKQRDLLLPRLMSGKLEV